MREESSNPVARWRYFFVVFILLLCVTGLVWRMFDLMVVDRTFLLKQGDARTLRVVSIPAYRGMIVDRDGQPLAISTPVESVWLNPQKFRPSHKQLSELIRLLDLKKSRIKSRLKINSKREFMYIKRQINPMLAAKVKALGIEGIHFKPEFRRYYPDGEVTAHLTGFTNIDDQGQEGLELAYNDWLRGIPGKKQVLVDRYGHIVADTESIREARPGHNLVLSVDSRIQYLAYRDLKAAVSKFEAKSGSIVVLDVKTGEILAMANVPSYNPNHRVKAHDNRFRNRAVTDIFEPGSTIKAFSVVNALDSGNYTPDTIIDTSPGWMMVNGNRVHDDRDNGKISVTTILQRSSNMGVTKLTLSLPPDSLPSLLNKLGFGHRTNIVYPGESSGYLPYHTDWKPFSLATLSFGYGLAVTDIQLASAYAVLAAGGVKRPVSLLKVNHPVKGERIFSEKVAKEVVTMLETVVEHGGTATRARVPGYRVAGKTGTVRIAGPGGYEKNHHRGLFVGMAPASNPRLVIAVIINDPRSGQYYGGLVAAPVFSQVMGGALRLLDIPPDKAAPVKG